MTSLEHCIVLHRVVAAVAHEMLYTEDELRCGTTKPVARARQLAWWLTREITGATYPDLARIVSRDRTTLMHGCQKIASLLHVDAALARQMRSVIARLDVQQRARMSPAEAAAE
ncbi:MAG TPA: helix-turn-helix domain-containing protein [Candidatus Limnocylindria bacterium]|nr:helix-turn-helix domain-containing protein [Candidatus Limnocylindria bacterium]